MSKNEPFAPWQCPLCGEKLTGDSTLKCTKGHCFDRAKEGYWHLLPVQSMRTKAPGDSKEMVAARRAFLNAGYYGIFGKAVGELCAEYGQPASPEAALHLLDAGCGEGWYDRCIAQALAEKGRRVQLAGFDIAKPAVRLPAKALPTAQYAVASSFSQPVRTGWADLLLNCFSPFAQEEFLRVLRPGGRMIYVVPGAEHLYQMKAVLYEKPYKNPVQQIAYDGFAADQCAGAAEHQAKADDPVARGADAEVHHILHQNITGVLGTGETGFTQGEARLHKVDEERSHERPTGVDGAEHNFPYLPRM